ncbi:MAG: pirin family protein [Polyangiaceae bacterium]|nr:pirin family protein [Polyangiaceae bacterium]
MSVHTDPEPAACIDCSHVSHLETLIDGRGKDLGGLEVRRVLPAIRQRRVGPFIFFDHFGEQGGRLVGGMQVRPHPHINLATVTYLFEGAILHRDSLGSEKVIRPGAVNWMTAGRGIVHSERMPDEVIENLHGVQVWLGLPQADEEIEPRFEHYPAEGMPALEQDGVSLRVIAGEAYGLRSPVKVHSPMFYVDAELSAGSTVSLPDGYAERAAYVAVGELESVGSDGASVSVGVGQMAVFSGGEGAAVKATRDARVMLLGGAPLDGDRHMWWNFVSSQRERIDEAKAEWQRLTSEGKSSRFERVPGDEAEFIPLPER